MEPHICYSYFKLSSFLFFYLWVQNRQCLPILPDLGCLCHKCLPHSHITELRRRSSEIRVRAECNSLPCLFRAGIEPGALHVLGRCCTLEIYPQSFIFFLYFEIESH